MRFRHSIPVLCILLPSATTFADEMRESPYVVTPDEQFVAGGANISKLIYVNDCQPDGCFIRARGYNDSIQDASTIPNADSTVSAFAWDPQVWDDTITCLRQVYGPFDVEIVTEDPGDVPHHEAILAGSPEEIGQPAQVGGVAPFSCSPQNNVISFSFANSTGPDWIELCWTAAQESAHAFGLDHAFECLDPMTYIPNCGQKFFRNEALPCGEFEERTCNCSGLVQNSHLTLLEVFGEGTLPPPPVVEIVAPFDGQTVNDGFLLGATALDPRLVSRIELWINGWLYAENEGYGYFDREDVYPFDTDSLGLPDGILDIEVIAYNDLEVQGSDAITVTKGAPCQNADSCIEGQECNDGRCLWPDPTGQLGDVCERAMDCVSLQCAELGGEAYCSESCIPSLSDQCPESFECLEQNGSQTMGYCWPAQAADGCCSVGRGGAPTSGQLALFLLVALALVWRRKRS